MADDKETMPEEESISKKGEERGTSRTPDGKKYLIGAIIGALILGFIVVSGAVVLRLANREVIGRTRGMMMIDRDPNSFNLNNNRGDFIRIRSSLSGNVTAVNGSTFTLNVNGQSKNVQISSNTRFPLSSATSVKVGDNVEVVGQQDSNGVVQATLITVNPS